MTWSGFRPSDDACFYGYNIPANAFAAVSLDRLAVLLGNDSLAAEARGLAAAIRDGISEYGIVDVEAGRIYAYEVDGLGGTLLLDDAATSQPALAAVSRLL